MTAPDIDHAESCECPACQPSFFDRLASLCGPEIAAAMRSDDTDRAGELIEALSTMLGRTIARAAKGERSMISDLLDGSSHLMAEEAAGMAGVINLAKSIGWKTP